MTQCFMLMLYNTCSSSVCRSLQQRIVVVVVWVCCVILAVEVATGSGVVVVVESAVRLCRCLRVLQRHQTTDSRHSFNKKCAIN